MQGGLSLLVKDVQGGYPYWSKPCKWAILTGQSHARGYPYWSNPCKRRQDTALALTSETVKASVLLVKAVQAPAGCTAPRRGGPEAEGVGGAHARRAGRVAALRAPHLLQRPVPAGPSACQSTAVLTSSLGLTRTTV